MVSRRLDAKDYNEYLEKYSGDSSERSHFIAVCGFFELSPHIYENFELLNNKRLSWKKRGVTGGTTNFVYLADRK
jgi:hypothetical protein